MARQHTTPMIVRGSQATRLRRVSLNERTIDEGWLQQLLIQQPALLPAGEIEPAFAELIPLARELPTRAGPIDLVYLTPDGYLALVETKLWRNPEARRQVIAQLLDYAKEVARWSYQDLVEAVRRANGQRNGDPLVEAAGQMDDGQDFDEADFIDAVTRHLRQGRFLLLIVGDGIREDVEQIAAYIQHTPQLGYRLGLVELALYQSQDMSEELLFVQPRIIARTEEVTRAVVEVRGGTKAQQVHVSLPQEQAVPATRRTSITEEQFYTDLENSVGSEMAQQVQQFLADLPEHVSLHWGKGGPTLRYIDPATNHEFSLASLLRNGRAYIERVPQQCRRAGIPEQIGTRYLEAVAALIPDASVLPEGALTKDSVATVREAGSYPTLRSLMVAKDQWVAEIRQVVEALREHLDTL